MLANQSNSGTLTAKKVKTHKLSPLSWRLRQWTRPDLLFGTAVNFLARQFSRWTGIPTMTSELRGVLVRTDGTTIDYGILSRRVITTAWVNFVVDQLQTETSEFGDLKYHDSGVGTTGAAVGDTDIETTDGESRATGSQTEGGSANVYRSVGTISYTTTKAITEHGLFTQSSGGTMVDRHTFSAINVVNGDSIQFTYDYTVSSGG